MEILNLEPKDLKTMIEEGTIISNKGGSCTVFSSGGRVIKLQKQLYQYLKLNHERFANEVVCDRYGNRNQLWKRVPFVDVEQIKYFLEKQKNIKLTTFDKGVVTVNADGTPIVCGVILNDLTEYKDITDIELNSPSELLKILYRLLAAIKELDDNGISHIDLARYGRNGKAGANIMYNGTDVQICDLSGELITYGDNFDRLTMYHEYATAVSILIDKLKHLYPFLEEIQKKLDTIIDYESARNSLEEIKGLVK